MVKAAAHQLFTLVLAPLVVEVLVGGRRVGGADWPRLQHLFLQLAPLLQDLVTE